MRFDKKYLNEHEAAIDKIARRVSFVCCIGLACLAFAIRIFPLPGIDLAITRELQEASPGALEPAMRFVSLFGVPWVAILYVSATAFLFYLFSYKREAAFTLMVFLADGANSLIKAIVDRPRPSASLVEVFQKLEDPSFPSGHVEHYIVFFGFVYVLTLYLWDIPRWAEIIITLAYLDLVVLVSLSRMYLGAHWATDILGGYLAGFSLLWLLLHLYFRGSQKPSSFAEKN